MKTILKPIEDRVLIKRDEAPEKLAGLDLSEAHKKTHQPPKGTVVAVGPGKADKLFLQLIGYKFDGEFYEVDEKPSSPDTEPVYTTTTMPLKEGDRVMYGAYANMEVEDPETKEKFICLRLADCFVLLQGEQDEAATTPE